jgi:ribosomal-protein-alanine N-acetyltransferase
MNANIGPLIRPMTITDLEAVLVIDRASFTLPWPERSFRYELLENTASHCWVAETHTESGAPIIVGMIVAWLILDEVHIATIAVAPGSRGLGIGKMLLQTALQECTHLGAVSATLEVREHNETAIHLYRQFGFEVVGRRKRYYSDTHEDALLMTREALHRDPLFGGTP